MAVQSNKYKWERQRCCVGTDEKKKTVYWNIESNGDNKMSKTLTSTDGR